MQAILGNETGNNLKTYFRQLERRFQVGLLLAFVIPLASLSAYFHFQFHVTLRQTDKLNLAAIAESQRNTVDLFLQERLVNLFALFHSSAFDLSPGPPQMERFLQQLRQVNDAFVDVGFLNDRGVQIGYAGPFPFLQNKDYSRQDWFIRLIDPSQNHYISDIYLGFRNKLHFTIAAKQIVDGRAYILRATLDPDKLYLFLKTISHGKGVDSVIINREGRFQLSAPGLPLSAEISDYIPGPQVASGTHVIQRDGGDVMVAHAWLAETRWALLVRSPLNQAYAQLYKARRIMLVFSTVVLAVVVAAIWFATRTLISKARENAEKKDELYEQLLHASKLASLGELATGVAHEINNPLAIIVATTGVINDMLNPEFGMQWTPEAIRSELRTIDSAVFRARGITQQLLNYGRKHPPRLSPTDINRLVEEVLGGLKERVLTLADVTVARDLDPNLPEILADADQIRQVLFNLLNNAQDAIQGPGRISVSTRRTGDSLRITITDTGKGMDSEQIKRIFDPFYTTKDVGKGTGLGLSVSISIVEAMGGTIEVQSLPGAGSAFTVILPMNQPKGVVDEQTRRSRTERALAENTAD